MRLRWRVLVMIVGAAVGGLGWYAVPASAEDNGLVRTPPMGWNDWDVYGCNISEQVVVQAADAIVASGMKAAGYEYVNIDDCWLAPSRASSGSLEADPAKFPDGIKAVADYVHRLGLKLGIYEDAGTQTCVGLPGSYGHESQDAATFASWGVDYLKYDQCNIPFAVFPGLSHQQIERTLYTRMSDALKATGRPILFAMSNGADLSAAPWLWGGSIADLWRTTSDLQDNFSSLLSNFEGTVHLYPYASPGHWNDPDLLEVGNGGSTNLEYRTEFSLWAEMAAPLIASTRLNALLPADLAILTNAEVIAVDQDPRGAPGIPISDRNGLWTLTKRLRHGDRSVLLFNATNTAAMVKTTAARAGLPRAGLYRLRDLWSNDASETRGTISAFVPAHGVAMFRVTAVSERVGARLPPEIVVALSADVRKLCRNRSITVAESIADNGLTALTLSGFSLRAPRGWRVRTLGRPRAGTVAGGTTVAARFRVIAPAIAHRMTSASLTGAASYRVSGGLHRTRATVTEVAGCPSTPPPTR
jgi:alpha-galactosidase